MPPTPLGYSLLALNHERLTRWLAPARLRTAHVTGCGTELLQGIIRHAAEPCTQLLVFYIRLRPLWRSNPIEREKCGKLKDFT